MSEHRAVNRLDWWKRDRFGMFIHWGLYSLTTITGRDMWAYSSDRVPQDQYETLAKRFNPVDFDPSEWARLAVEAGMKYAVITTKHHDGYCLFDSDLTDFKATNSPCGRDLIAEWVKAFRAAGLGVGLYYSLLDWHHPHYTMDCHHPQRDNDAYRSQKRDWDKYLQYTHGQVREILTKYGKIDILWADFAWKDRPADAWKAKELTAMIRKLQPDILLNNRLGLTGDFTTPEQWMPEKTPQHEGKPMPWEECMTIGQSWGYDRQDLLHKSAARLVRTLVECVSMDGNLLLNVGPTPTGRIQDELATRLREMGKWLRLNGRSIYGAGPTAYTPPLDSRYTQRDDKLFLHLLNYTGRDVRLPGLDGKVAWASLLRDGSDVRLKSEDGELFMIMPMHVPDEMDTVVELQLQQP